MSLIRINKIKAEKIYNKGQPLFFLPLESEFKLTNLIKIQLDVGFEGNFDFSIRISEFEFRFKTKPIIYMKGK
jgi:hypothetical protein